MPPTAIMSRSRKRARRPHERPEEIGAAALKLFSRLGYHETTIDDIANEAGVTKGAVYHHFASKEEVLEYALQVYLDRVFAVAELARRESGSTLEYIRDGLLRAATRLWTSAEFSAIFCLAFGDVGRLFPRVRQRFISRGPLRGWEELARAIAQGQQEGIFRRDIQASVAARILTSATAMQCIVRRGMGASEDEMKDIAEESIHNALKMLSVPS
jgi:AcrR family transcriptional regulator